MFTWQSKVRNYELDNQGIVNNATYLNYFEQARAEFVAAHHICPQAYEQAGFHFVIAKITIDYKRSLFANDAYTVEVAIKALTTKRIIFQQRLIKTASQKVAAVAIVEIACMEIKTRRACMPDMLIKDMQPLVTG